MSYRIDIEPITLDAFKDATSARGVVGAQDRGATGKRRCTVQLDPADPSRVLLFDYQHSNIAYLRPNDERQQVVFSQMEQDLLAGFPWEVANVNRGTGDVHSVSVRPGAGAHEPVFPPKAQPKPANRPTQPSLFV